MPPRTDRLPGSPPERRALQDALAWPVAATLLVSAAVVFFLPRVVPPRFLALAVGAVFAVVTVSLVGILAWVIERWLISHSASLAQDAERKVQSLGVAGLPMAAGDSALIPLASAFADAGARAALRSAERESNDLLAQLGGDAAGAAERAIAGVRSALAAVSPAAVVYTALDRVADCATALRHVTAPVPLTTQAVDIVTLIPDVLAQLPFDARARVSKVITTDRGFVIVDRARIAKHLAELLDLALQASPDGGIVTLNVSRLFRSNIEETPVRRTGDSRLTIVPRASDDSLRTWVQRAQPGAEVLSIVVTDTGTAPTTDDQSHAFDAFALSRPGDPLGVTLAAVRRTVAAAKGTLWIDTSREGGAAVHLLLPIASAGAV
jgi:signal transduction histidine kinase